MELPLPAQTPSQEHYNCLSRSQLAQTLYLQGPASNKTIVCSTQQKSGFLRISLSSLAHSNKSAFPPSQVLPATHID